MSEEEIIKMCNKLHIKNHIINSDGSIDVKGDVILSRLVKGRIPIPFNRISGNFICCDSELTTLENSPRYIKGNFNVDKNKLTNLENSPISIGGYFSVEYNNLISLKGSEKITDIKNIYFCNNKLVSLKYHPIISDKYIYAFNSKYNFNDNPILSLEDYNDDYDKLLCYNKEKLILKSNRSKKIRNFLET